MRDHTGRTTRPNAIFIPAKPKRFRLAPPRRELRPIACIIGAYILHEGPAPKPVVSFIELNPVSPFRAEREREREGGKKKKDEGRMYFTSYKCRS